MESLNKYSCLKTPDPEPPDLKLALIYCKAIILSLHINQILTD